jgi:mannose-1-phosphate guanylyltransferase/phosphomannomutase
MRHLVETTPQARLELIDGVKILGDTPDDWVLVLPDAGEPLVHIYANSQSHEWLNGTLAKYQQHVQDFIEKEQGIKEIMPL